MQDFAQGDTEITRVIVADGSKNETDNETEHDRFAKDAEALLDRIRADINAVDSGNAFQNPIQDDGNRQDLR